MQKRELRKIFQAQRMGLSITDYSSRCALISHRFFSDLNLNDVNVIHTFLSIDKTKEPDMWLIINRLHDEFPKIRISIPRIVPQTNELENFYLDSLRQLVTNEWGIPEPASGTHTPTAMIDLVLVPLLAFDLQGHRVGYGKGFYDRFLQQCRPDTLRIGVSLFPPIEKIEDVSEFDIPLHSCITPEKIYFFKPQVPVDSGNGKNPSPK